MRTDRTGELLPDHDSRITVGLLLLLLSDHRVCSASLFSEQEIQEIRGMTFHDVLVAVTSAEAADLQQEVFFWTDGNCLELKRKEEGLTGSRGEEVV